MESIDPRVVLVLGPILHDPCSISFGHVTIRDEVRVLLSSDCWLYLNGVVCVEKVRVAA